MGQIRALAPFLGLLIAVSACAPPARSVAPRATEMKTAKTPASDSSAAQAPLAMEEKPPSLGEQWELVSPRAVQLPHGLQACVSQRPALSRSYVGIEFGESFSSVERMLLKHWVSAIVSENRQGDLHCAPSFACFFADEKSVLALTRMGEALPRSVFFSTHPILLSAGQHQEEVSPLWVLENASQALSEDSQIAKLYAERALTVTEGDRLRLVQRENASLLHALAKQTGSARIKRVTFLDAKRLWQRFLRRARLHLWLGTTAESFRLPQEWSHDAQVGGTDRPMNDASRGTVDAPSHVPVVLPRKGEGVSDGLISWRLPRAESKEGFMTLVEALAAQVDAMRPGLVKHRVMQRGGTIQLLVTSSYEALEVWLGEFQKRALSPSLTQKELTSAVLDRRRVPFGRLRSACPLDFNSPKDAPSSEERDAFRKRLPLGLQVIWGSPQTPVVAQ